MLNPINYDKIRTAASVYQEKILSFKGQVYNTGGINFDSNPLIIYMPRTNIENLLKQDTCENIAAVLNVDDDHFSIALLCADKDNNILPAHIKLILDGEETWPNMVTINNPDALRTKLPPPQK